jgi:coenzyme F420-reducing hydrogenase gamma subunit
MGCCVLSSEELGNRLLEQPSEVSGQADICTAKCPSSSIPICACRLEINMDHKYASTDNRFLISLQPIEVGVVVELRYLN